ncbi:MAG: hypothetical protein ABI861_01755 [Panacibacter sp.]
MKKFGYILLQISAYLIIAGGIGDLMMTFLFDSLPASHLTYLKVKSEAVSIELKNLDHAFLRAIGGCIIAIGIGALTIIYGPIRKGLKQPIIPLLCMVTIGEGGNSLQMILVDSPYFYFPFICVIITWSGVVFWWYGNKYETK